MACIWSDDGRQGMAQWRVGWPVAVWLLIVPARPERAGEAWAGKRAGDPARQQGPVVSLVWWGRDPTDHVTFAEPHRKAFSGKCVAILRGKKGQSGKAVLKVASEGLPVASAEVGVE